MLPQDLHELIRHMEWADALVWKAALALPEAHADPRTLERLHHIHHVQWAYLRAGAILTRLPLVPPAPYSDFRNSTRSSFRASVS